MSIRVQSGDFDVGAEIAALRAGDTRIGAIAAFVGLVRDINDGDAVRRLALEHYPGMTERALERIENTALNRFKIDKVLIIHRIGTLQPSDQIVLVVTAGGHRGDAFAACEFIMDYLKTQAPFWKKEGTPGGDRWVEAKASDDEAADRWTSPGRNT